jgi:hypothetical protein
MKKSLLVGAALMCAGCTANLQQLKTRAALDFDCHEQSIEVKEVDSGTQQAFGCGKRAVYVVQFNNARYPTWLLNSEIRNQESASR